ncbi:TonB-dependent receptor plug domain-containing protein [Pseudoalteromonas aurantia]|uniref:TonB-dependent receptor plug domain-containing protein n=1 Tax=Pseudoalteromonas aurantia TaxID=43654 RepID=UPI0020162049|nr:TonB-dependent receptor [Pseudoalteromonas aurantia]
MFLNPSHFLFCILLCLPSATFAKPVDLPISPISVTDKTEVIEVVGVRKRLYQQGLLKDSTVKTELISQQQIKANQAANLSDAISNSIGIRVSNECSMCGAKRVMINGLKGEHTNVLVDGIPLHTMLSGFYGMDAVAMSGVGQIEIARGAGASLTAPEAIGGTINLVTQVPTKSGGDLDVSMGNMGYKKAALMGSLVPQQKNISASVIVQVDEREQFDGDKNGVSENPYLDNTSLTTLLSYDYDRDTNMRLRLNHTKSEVFGGPMLGDITASIEDAIASEKLGTSDNLFENGHVANRYIGQPWQTAEWVKTQRNEALASILQDFNTRLNGTFSLAHVNHKQVSFYEGIDYDATDTMYYADARFNFDLNASHLITFGVDYRKERMRSHSDALAGVENYVSDSFDYLVQGIYIQDSWMVTPALEISAAARLDSIKADFVDLKKPGVEIDKILLSPRIDSRFFHTEELTSRLSFGQGYRAPLSFFESDHGILDAEKGYLLNVSEPERSTSINYSLNFENALWVSTLSMAHTSVKDLATLEHNTLGVPVLSQLKETARVLAVDFSASYQLNSDLNITVTGEVYHYNDVFKTSFAIAPIEQRATVSSNWQHKLHTVDASLIYIPSRDLSDYQYSGYEDRFATQQKPTSVSAFSTLDVKYQYKLSPYLGLYVGVNNLFDYTQGSEGSSPLLFDEEGGYDVTYIYAPLRGRLIYAGFDWSF